MFQRTALSDTVAERRLYRGDHMRFERFTASTLAGACLALCVGVFTAAHAQQPPPGQTPGGAGRGGRGAAAVNVFTAGDADKNGVVTRDELQNAFAKWLTEADAGKSGSVSQEQLATAINAAFPQAPAPGPGGGGRGPQNQTPNPADVVKMMAALPERAPAS